MITITDIRNRIRRSAESIHDLSGTVVNLKSSFTNSPNSTPEVARRLNQARWDAKDAILFVDNARSRPTQRSRQDDDDDLRDDDYLADNRRLAAKLRKGTRINARRLHELKCDTAEYFAAILPPTMSRHEESKVNVTTERANRTISDMEENIEEDYVTPLPTSRRTNTRVQSN